MRYFNCLLARCSVLPIKAIWFIYSNIYRYAMRTHSKIAVEFRYLLRGLWPPVCCIYLFIKLLYVWMWCVGTPTWPQKLHAFVYTMCVVFVVFGPVYLSCCTLLLDTELVISPSVKYKSNEYSMCHHRTSQLRESNRLLQIQSLQLYLENGNWTRRNYELY